MTEGETEQRILRAILTALHMRVKSFNLGAKTFWPEVIQEFMDAYAASAARAPVFVPTALDIDRVLADMQWFRVLDRHQAELVFHRARGVSFGTMAQIYGRSDQTMTNRYRKAIKVVCQVANGETPLPAAANHSGMMFNPSPTRVRRGRIRASYDAKAGQG